MLNTWSGKIAVVTGGSSGIGASIILALAKVGIKVVGLARRVHQIEQLAMENPDLKDLIFAFPCDISCIMSVKEAYSWIQTKFDGHLHILVNNAGRTKIGYTLDPLLCDEEIITTINTNLTGLVVCTREAYKLMDRLHEMAYIININSVQGHLSPNSTFSIGNLYGSTKHHTEVMRMDLASAGNKRIRVTSISPGATKTNINIAAGASTDLIDYHRIPHLQPTDISDAVLYLLSLPAHVNITEMIIKPTGEMF